MKVYSVPEALVFLREEYGQDNMPTSEETIRRAIRCKQLSVIEEGDPGRKGYSVTEDSLRNFAEMRLSRARARKGISQEEKVISDQAKDAAELQKSFPELYREYISGIITSQEYYMALFREKEKWEQQSAKAQENMRRLDVEKQILENEIDSCQSAIKAFEDGIKKFST